MSGIAAIWNLFDQSKFGISSSCINKQRLHQTLRKLFFFVWLLFYQSQILAQRELDSLSIQLYVPSYLCVYPSPFLPTSKAHYLIDQNTLLFLKFLIILYSTFQYTYMRHSKLYQKTWPTLRSIYVQETNPFCFLFCSSKLSILPFQEKNLCKKTKPNFGILHHAKLWRSQRRGEEYLNICPIPFSKSRRSEPFFTVSSG